MLVESWGLVVLSLLVAVLTSWLCVENWLGGVQAANRFAAIDGLRGFLAWGVFIHHAGFWMVYRSTGTWASPQSNLLHSLGRGSVILFFMITAFLFYGKLLESRGKGFDWRRLLVGRVARIAPAYMFATVLVLFSVAIESGFQLRVGVLELLRAVVAWMTFTFAGMPDVNGVAQTKLISAGVNWSLPYEWMFYLWLPALGLLVGVRPTKFAVGAMVLSAGVFLVWRPEVRILMSFGGGLLAVHMARMDFVRRFAESPAGSVAVCVLLGVGFAGFSNPFAIAPLLLISGAFVLVAAGADIFGLLSSRVSRAFGEATYSVYLLHGVVLYWLFTMFTPSTVIGHWIAVVAVTPLVFVLSNLSFKFVEQPAMRAIRRR